MQEHESSKISLSNTLSLNSREKLFELMNNYPSSDDEKERSLFLFIRGSLMARLFGVQEVYQKIINIPGCIIDVGTWRGQTAVMCENLRSIYEPLNLNRRIIAFDTFTGYKGFTSNDNSTNLHKNGTYSTGEEYDELLNEIIELHEKNNVLGHNYGKHKIIKGDCLQTIPDFFNENSNEFVSLSFFDVNSYKPTLEAFKTIYNKTVPGGVIAFWQLSRKGEVIQAEGKVYVDEILNKYSHSLRSCKSYPGLCYIIKE
jgi:hypothetical protein